MTSIFFHGSCFCLLFYFSYSCTVKVGESDVRTSATIPRACLHRVLSPVSTFMFQLGGKSNRECS